MDAISTSQCRQFEPSRHFGETSHLHESFQTFVSESDPELTQKVESGESRQQQKEQSKTSPDVSWLQSNRNNFIGHISGHLCRMSVLLTGRSSLWWRKTAVDCSPESAGWSLLTFATCFKHITRIFWTHCMKPLEQSFRPKSQAQPCHGRWVDLSAIPHRGMA